MIKTCHYFTLGLFCLSAAVFSHQTNAAGSGDLPMLSGSVVSATDWPSENDLRPTGLYLMKDDGSIELQFLGPRAYSGGIAIDGVYYATTLQSAGAYYRLQQGAFDMQTGEQLGSNEIINQYDMAAIGGLVADPTTGIIYGISTTGMNNALWDVQLATFNYRVVNGKVECEVSPISKLSGTWGALSCDADGQLYAIKYDLDASGNVTSTSLYKINKQTGGVTLLGETGMIPYYNFADHLSASVIDPQTGKMYWTFMDPSYTSMLAEVDLVTGKATKIFNLKNNARFGTLFIPETIAPDAPGQVKDLKGNFQGGALTGEITFTAPTTLANGSNGSGNLQYTIKSGNETIASGTTTYGGNVAAAVTMSKSDYYSFVVRVSNNAGESELARLDTYVGFGVPSAPVVILEEKAGKLVLSWQPVTTTVTDGYIDPSAVRYNIYDKNLNSIANGIAETSYTIEIPVGEEVIEYYYYVEADNQGMISERGESNRYMSGYEELPYYNGFDNAASFDGFIILDENGDGQQWKQSNGEARVGYTPGISKDDWLIAPPVRLEAGKAYRVSFIARGHAIGYIEKLEAKWGTAPKPEGMTNTVIEPFEVNTWRSILHDGWMIPETTGTYYFGIHCITEPTNQYWVFVDDLLIEEGVGVQAPYAPTEISVIPDPSGELAATISFKAPEVDFTGEKLSSLSAIDIERDGVKVKTFENPAPGEQLSFTDACEVGGIVTYAIIPSNSFGSGKRVYSEVFVGFDKPVDPVNVLLEETENSGEVKLSWDPVTKDINGLEIPADKIKYNVLQQTTSGWTVKYEGLEDTSVTFRAVGDDEQVFCMYAVVAVNAGGESEMTVSNYIVVGTPYTDLHESFKNAGLSYIWASGYEEKVGSTEGWSLMSDSSIPGLQSVDGDNGYALFQGSTAGASAGLFTGKILIDGFDNPAVTFCTYNFPSNSEVDKNELTVLVKKASEEDWKEVKIFVMNDISEDSGWVSTWASLNDYKGEEIQIMFRAKTVNVLYTLLDNVNLQDVISNDVAAAGVSAPESVVKGSEYNVDVIVENTGFENIGNITVTLFANDEEVGTENVANIEPGMRQTVTFSQTMPIDATEAIAYHAVVDAAADMNIANNTSTIVKVSPAASIYPGVEGLAAARNENEVVISWQKPLLTGTIDEPTTEGFENADSFSFEVDGWTIIDRDEKPVAGFSNTPLPNLIPTISTAPFVVFDVTDESILGNASFAAHSGIKYIGSIVPSDDSQVDDWAISPILSGKAQTIKFYARSFSSYYLETVEVLWSTGSIKPENFQSVKTISNIPAAWTPYEVEIPEGATRFAVRNCGTNGWLLMLDDFSFTALRDLSTLGLQGYDVYRDGIKVAELSDKVESYTDTEAGDQVHLYGVAAVYNEGVSKFSFINSNNEAGIGQLSDISLRVESGRIIIDGAEGLLVQVFGIDGRTYHNVVANHNEVVEVPAGVYVVKAGANCIKVVVR